MDLTYTYEQAQYREGVQRFVSRVLAPLINDKYDFDRLQTREEVAALRADVSGHEIATTAPVDENGRLDLICLGIFIEEISKLNPSLASLATPVFFPVWDLGSLLQGSQQEKYGHMFGPGEIVAMGMSEPNAGSHLAGLQTTARRDGDGWVLNGNKIWTSNAQIAAGIIVAARNLESGLISLFLVDATRQQYEVRTIPKLGWHATSFCEVSFVDCRLDGDAELTPGKGGLKTALSFVEEARIKMMFMAVGIAQAALDLAVEYAKVRQQFGRPIGSFQLVQGMLADMAIETELSRLMAYRVASQFMAGERCRKTVSIAKAYTCEAAVRVASLGIQVHGAIGLTKECAAERYFRDARLLTIPDGTTEIHKLTIGRELTGLDAFA
ncbi:acyl-CoA dehydrogenase family protein [Rhizorhabdus dicambivorans]|uniref:Acyl-CoA dehydrogenase n=1 Tax=Rhizorhabdus dicambivorans TaxID=1850238 RepID=A0A2A4FSG9_9SPHN|nr:acyl-CoA dehydrogenase [Rhizorhabdus dicambivorans]ATE64578.1 acyl-CoA dehydrogenase [Rhizorhabdus dicambivorans]PCE41675.1 acyl-CoA dehydrogenase [Rhizorhabdus dicambivorans]